MRNPWLCVKDFEQSISNYTGSRYVVTVDSCTNAIFLSLKFLKKSINKDTVVKIPSRTYIPLCVFLFNLKNIYQLVEGVRY